MRLSAPSLTVLALGLLANKTSAIYADDAFHVDYHHALIGAPQSHTTFFHRPSANSKASLLYTLSVNGILGAVNPKDGAVLWRQRLGKEGLNYTHQGLLKIGEGSNTIVSALDASVKTWDAMDGRMGWSWQGMGKVKALAITEEELGRNDVLVLSEEGDARGTVRCFSKETGTIIWQHIGPSGDIPQSLILAKGKLFYVSLHAALLKGFKIKATELDPVTGKQRGQPVIFNSESEVSSEDDVLYIGTVGESPMIIWSDKTFKTVKVISVLQKHVSTISVPLVNRDPLANIAVCAPRDGAALQHFLLHFEGAESHWARVYHVDLATGHATEAYDLPYQAGKGVFSTSTQGKDVYFVRHGPSEVILVSSKSSNILYKWKLPSPTRTESSDLRALSHAVTELVVRGDKFSIRSALALRSGDWELVRNGESLWIRPESLTGVVAAAFTEVARAEGLAQELAVEEQSNFFSAYLHRVRRHARDLQHLPEWLEDTYEALIASVSGNRGPASNLSARPDKFGFNKILLLATSHGRLAALDIGNNGEPIWNIQAVSLEPGSTWDVIGMNVEDNCMLIRAAKGEFLRVETRTGKTLDYQRSSLISGLDTLATVADSHGRQALIPVNADGSLGSVPEADFGDGTIVVTRSDDNSLKGWTINDVPRSTLAWRFSPFSGEIREVLHRPDYDPVASIGKALGDRNVLYKYLNPNVLLVTSIDSQASTATFSLLDSASGTLLHSTTHSDVDLNRSISSTISENFFAYSFFSETVSQDPLQLDRQKLKGYRLVISELYESPYPNDRGPFSSTSNFSSTQPAAASEGDIIETPFVISQSFLIPGPISHMSMTSTMQGITPRSLLCIVPHLNDLLAIPRYIIDPRRPVGRDPTAPEMEEGLFRYNAMLEFEPKWSLNHKRHLLGLANVITNPSLLESTSLVFAYGDADIFGTRVSPIGGFDVLGKGFSKLQLVATVAALAVATSLLAPLVRLSSPFALAAVFQGRADMTLQVRKKQIDGRWRA